MAALTRKNKIQLAEGTDVDCIAEQTAGYSAAELEAVLLRALNIASEEQRIELNNDDLITAATDVIPSRDTKMLEYMELLAVFESSSKEMLIEKYRDMTTEDVHQRLGRLRTELGIYTRA